VPDTDLPTTHTTTVTEDQIDHLGHMNVRFYGVAARAGTAEVLRRLAPGTTHPIAVEVPDVFTRHLREQLLGARLSVRSGVLEARPRRLRLYHELVNDETGDLAASFVHRVRVTDDSPPAWADPGDLRLDEVPERGRSRTIDVEVDSEALAPPLAVSLERSLAFRHPRVITADEVGPDGRLRPADAPMLIWLGEELEAGTGAMLHPGPDGQLLGWANLESRIRVHRLPQVGDRIQSFGATLAVADKTCHRWMWAYDLDRAELLCSFEIVDLAFDTVARRAVSIPDDLRANAMARLHPDLRHTTTG
jgi:acyl-CoA thioesterase FadM